MAINEEHRQTEVAAELEEAARTLAHSTLTVPRPSDSYTLLGELHAATDHLAQVCQQLAAWHAHAEDGTHHDGEDARGDGTGAQAAAGQLRQAASALSDATQAIMAAHAANGVVRWYDSPQT